MKTKLIAASALLLVFSCSELSAQTEPTPSPKPQVKTEIDKPSADYMRPDGKTRAKRYVNSMFGPESLAKAVGTAGISTWRNSPEEWVPVGKGLASGSRLTSARV